MMAVLLKEWVSGNIGNAWHGYEENPGEGLRTPSLESDRALGMALLFTGQAT